MVEVPHQTLGVDAVRHQKRCVCMPKLVDRAARKTVLFLKSLQPCVGRVRMHGTAVVCGKEISRGIPFLAHSLASCIVLGFKFSQSFYNLRCYLQRSRRRFCFGLPLVGEAMRAGVVLHIPQAPARCAVHFHLTASPLPYKALLCGDPDNHTTLTLAGSPDKKEDVVKRPLAYGNMPSISRLTQI